MSDWDPFHLPALPIDLFLTIYKTNNALVKGLEERIQAYDLTLGKLCLLVALRRAGKPALPSELSDDLAVTRANVSGLLNGLERMNLVVREVDPSNRRRVLVRLTNPGRELLDRVWPIYIETVTSRMETKLTVEEQRQLSALLRKLT